MPGETEHYEVNKHYKERENIIILMKFWLLFWYIKYYIPFFKKKRKGLDEDEAKPRKA